MTSPLQPATREQMRRLDGAAVDAGVSVEALMERAGKAVADVARRMVKGKRILVLCGSGNNGGDGLVAARHLMGSGYGVKIICSSGNMKELPLKQREKLEGMGADFGSADDDFSGYDLIVDALLGFSTEGNPRGIIAGLIRKCNESRVAVLAVDLPSGLDADSGHAYEPCTRAAATVTLAAVKKGLIAAKSYAGRVFLADIGAPEEAYAKAGLENPFREGEDLREVTF